MAAIVPAVLCPGSPAGGSAPQLQPQAAHAVATVPMLALPRSHITRARRSLETGVPAPVAASGASAATVPAVGIRERAHPAAAAAASSRSPLQPGAPLPPVSQAMAGPLRLPRHALSALAARPPGAVLPRLPQARVCVQQPRLQLLVQRPHQRRLQRALDHLHTSGRFCSRTRDTAGEAIAPAAPASAPGRAKSPAPVRIVAQNPERSLPTAGEPCLARHGLCRLEGGAPAAWRPPAAHGSPCGCP